MKEVSDLGPKLWDIQNGRKVANITNNGSINTMLFFMSK